MAQVAFPLTFRSFAHLGIGLRLVGGGEALEEQPRVRHHPLTDIARGTWVVLEPPGQFASGQRCRLEGIEQDAGMVGVGARQRRQDARGGPSRERAIPYGLQQRVGQAAHQVEAATDPAHVASGLSRHFPLCHALTLNQFLQQQAFFDRGQRPLPMAGEEGQQALRQRAGPGFNPGGIPTQPAQGFDAPVAIDQDQAGAVHFADGDARHQLPALFDGAGQGCHRPRDDQACRGKAQVQSVQVDFVIRRHGRHSKPMPGPWR